MPGFLIRVAVSLFALTAVGVGSAQADDVANFYKSHDITFLIGTSSGGGYDLAGRLLAPFLSKHIPGHPRIVVENMAGAGGIIAANYLYKEAPKDGTMIGGVLNNTPFEPLFGTKAARYDPSQFNWIGSTNPETAFLIVWHSVPVNSLSDAQRREITVGTSGASSAPTFFARLLNETLHTKLKIIPGYPGTSEAFLAMENGELDGYGSAFTSDLTSFKPEWIRDHKIKVIFQYGSSPNPDYPQTPFAPDAITNQSDRDLMQAGSALLAMGRPYAMPPATPIARVNAVRAAFAETIKDPALIAAARKAGVGLDRGQTGAQLEAIVTNAYKTPPALVARLKLLRFGS